MLQTIRNALATNLKTYFPENTLEFSRPPQWGMGQLALPLFQVAKIQKKNPAQLAKELENEFTELPTGVKSIKAFGPYLNFFLDWTWVSQQLLENSNTIHAAKPEKNMSPVLLEYSSPNLAKPLGIHHLRSTMIGHVLGNLYAQAGYPIIRYNYLGDMGASFGQVCKGLENAHGSGWEINTYTLDDLYQAYTSYQNYSKNKEWILAAAKYTKELELQNPYLIKLHKQVVEVTRTAFESIYKKLGVYFDVWDGESNYANQGDTVLKWIDKIDSLDIKDSEGARVLHYQDEVLPSLILIKSDATTVYLVRDILTAQYRMEKYHPQKLIYVVGSEQTMHFKQLKYVMEHHWVNETKKIVPEMIHVPYGLISIEGLKMSTRKGRVLLLDDVIEEGTQEMKKRMGQHVEMQDLEEKARQLATGAIIFSDLFHTIAKNVSFRWEDILNVEGDTGPYIYYAYARLSGILRKLSINRDDIQVPNKLIMTEEDETFAQVFMGVMEYDDVVLKSIELNDPSHFARYLLVIAKLANSFYHAYPVKDESHADRRATLLWVLKLIQQTLNSGANLLNIKLLEAL